MSKAFTTFYSAEEFQAKFDLDEAEVHRIIGAVGNARADLDAFMTV